MKHSDVIKKLKVVPCSPDADDIPNGPGVYWYSRGGKILYIGDSTKLKDRIKQEAAVPFTYESSSAVPSNLASTNLRLRRLIHEERETAKKEATCEYPAYVYHYTDFSASMAEMLKKEIKVSDSKKQIEEIFAAEVLKSVKKGWEIMKKIHK